LPALGLGGGGLIPSERLDRWQRSAGIGENVMVESVIAWLIVGAVAGWIAGKVVRGGGFGLLGNIVVGIIGAVVAGWLLPQLGIALGVGIVRAIINAAIGAIVLLVILSLIKRA
jgi:uncharacterized membrane protein YeaQ/YmgE (transglycosylase-associated protein family)